MPFGWRPSQLGERVRSDGVKVRRDVEVVRRHWVMMAIAQRGVLERLHVPDALAAGQIGIARIDVLPAWHSDRAEAIDARSSCHSGTHRQKTTPGVRARSQTWWG